MDHSFTITGTSAIPATAASRGIRQVLDGAFRALRPPHTAVTKPRNLRPQTLKSFSLWVKAALALLILIASTAFFMDGGAPKSRHTVWMPATTTPLGADQEAELLAWEIEQSAIHESRFATAAYPGASYSGTAANSVTRQASLEPLNLSTVYLPPLSGPGAEEGGILLFSNGRVYFRTVEGDLLVENFAAAYPKLPATYPVTENPAAAPGQGPEFAAAEYCAVAPDSGAALLSAWPGGSRLFSASTGLCSLRETKDPVAISRLIAQVSLSAPPSSGGSAGKYRTLIEQWASTYALSPSLVLAVMHTESNFNPFAVSASNALGLMQVVPETAGNEVYRFLKGSQGQPSVETLLSPEHNIKYGTTYLHLLARRYFGDVIDPRTREMCMIAAYNGGPGAVLRVFDKDREVAVATINSMTSDEVYETLTTKMPSAETRRYVEVVLGHQRNYAQ